MYGKLLIAMTMRIETGLHIGASNTYASIGAVNNPLIRDSMTGEPMLPGSSLKGKMRYLLARAYNDSYILPELEEEPDVLKRLFGSTGKVIYTKNKENGSMSKETINPITARLQFTDSFLSNTKRLNAGSGSTEIKFENTISRRTSVADPRQIERVVRGAEFSVKIGYTLEAEEDIKEDFESIALGLSLISMDYLGGGGSRGSGRVSFKDIKIDDLFHHDSDGQKYEIVKLQQLLNEKKYNILFDKSTQ